MDKIKSRIRTIALLLLIISFAGISVGAIVSTEDTAAQAAYEIRERPAIQRDFTKRSSEPIAELPEGPVEQPEAPEAPQDDPEPEAPEGPAEEPQEPEKAYIYYELGLSDEMQEYTQDICEKYEFPHYDIIAAMIQTESGCREKIISSTNDYGYMQINACNHKWLADELGITDFLDGKQNIEAGVYIIQGLYHKYEDIGKALMAYNCGEGGAANLWRQGIYSTQYSRLILQRAAELVQRETASEVSA